MTEAQNIDARDDDVASLQKQLIDDAWRLDVLAQDLGTKRNAAGLRSFLDAGFLDPEKGQFIGKSRYRGIYEILRDAPDKHNDLVIDWLKETNRFQPDVALEMLCQILCERRADYTNTKLAYRACAEAGMDMYRVGDAILSKWSELATTKEEITLQTCSAFATLMTRLPPYEVSNLVKEGAFPTFSKIPVAGVIKPEDEPERELNLLEYLAYLHAGNERNDMALKLLDKESSDVRAGLADSIVTVVRRFRDTTGDAAQTAVKIAAMINAGADLDRLADGLEAVFTENGGARHNAFHLLCGGDSKELSGMSGTRLEYLPAAIEALTQKITPVQARRFELDIDAVDHLGQTPLHLAVLCAEKDVVEKLLHGGANCHIKTTEGLTPADIARRDGRGDVLSLLQSYAARQAVQTVIDRARPQP
jgi:hypothetical protein